MKVTCIDCGEDLTAGTFTSGFNVQVPPCSCGGRRGPVTEDMTWYPVVDDCVGGWAIANRDVPISGLDCRPGGDEVIAYGVKSLADAKRIADALNVRDDTTTQRTATRMSGDELIVKHEITVTGAKLDGPHVWLRCSCGWKLNPPRRSFTAAEVAAVTVTHYQNVGARKGVGL